LSINAIVNITAHNGKAAEALTLIKKSQQLCLSMDECTGFEIFQNKTDIHKFLFVERWQSIEIHQAFLSELMKNDDFVIAMAVFTSQPKIEYYQIV